MSPVLVHNLQQVANNYAEALLLYQLFGPIPVGGGG